MSFIYSMKCKECQVDLVYTTIMDSGMDLLVDVEPCPECLKKEKDDGIEEERQNEEEHKEIYGD